MLLGVVPAVVVKLLFRERLSDYGVGLGVARRTWWSLALFTPVFLAAAYGASLDPEFLAKFPINPQAGSSPSMFAVHAVTYGLFYLGWEFYFRGFLLFGLRDSLGAVNAVLIQTLASALLHIGSPATESFGAVLGGLLWGALALRIARCCPAWASITCWASRWTRSSATAEGGRQAFRLRASRAQTYRIQFCRTWASPHG